MNQPEWADPDTRSTRGGDALIAYVAPKSVPSCVLSRHLDAKGMPLPMPESLIRRLHAGGVRRVLVGHTPHGNCPTIIKNGEGAEQVLVVMGDTSYSDMKSKDNRGQAVSAVSLSADGAISVRGKTQDGSAISYQVCNRCNRCNGQTQDGSAISYQVSQSL